jgi:hypothetical protein
MGPGIIRLLRASAGGAHRLRTAGCALLAAAALVPSQAHAQMVQSDTATARTQAAFLTPGSIVKTADMDFGSIAQANVAGTVVLSPQDPATCTVTGPLIRSGACRAARFSIMGRRNMRVRIRENNGGTVTLNGPGGATMFMNNLTVTTTGMSAVGGGNGWDFGNWRIDTNSGITQFWVGGTLNVGAGQAPGVYNGTLVIQIQFN